MKKKKIYTVKFEAICYEDGKKREMVFDFRTKGRLTRFELIGLFEFKKAQLIQEGLLKEKKQENET